MSQSDQLIKSVLTNYHNITIYGLSPDKSKASHLIAQYMRSKNYSCVGIYPGLSETEGFKIFPTIKEVPLPYRKLVNVFQRSEKIPQIVDEILTAGGVEVLWLQLGITHPEAEKRAFESGIKIISDHCIKIEHQRLF